MMPLKKKSLWLKNSFQRPSLTTLLASIIVLNVAGSLPLALAAPRLIDRVVAHVNQDLVLESDLKNFRRRVTLSANLNQYFSFFEGVSEIKPTTPLDKGPAREHALEYLVMERFILQQYPVSDSDVNAHIDSLRRENGESLDELKAQLKKSGFLYDDYREVVRETLGCQNLYNREIRGYVNVTEDDIRNEYFHSILKLPHTPVEYHIEMVSFNISDYKDVSTAKKETEKALNELKKGTKFESFSEGQETDLGFVGADQLHPQLKEELTKLQVGQLSPTIRAGEQFVIVRIKDVRTAQGTLSDKEKESLRERLVVQSIRRQFRQWIDRNRSSAYLKIVGSNH